MSDDDSPAVRPHRARSSADDPARAARGCRRRQPGRDGRPRSRPGERGALPASLSAELAGTVTLGSYEENAGIPALLADTKLFTKKTGIDVKTNTFAHGPFQEHINNYLQGRPDDVFTWFAGFRMQFFAAKGLATPIDDVWKTLTPQMPPAFKAASTGADGHQYFVPNKNYPVGRLLPEEPLGGEGLHTPRRRGPSSSRSPRRCRRTG